MVALCEIHTLDREMCVKLTAEMHLLLPPLRHCLCLVNSRKPTDLTGLLPAIEPDERTDRQLD